MERKKRLSPHSLYADQINGTIYLYKNGKLIRDNIFTSRSKRKAIMNEYFAQKKNNNTDTFYIQISLNI